MLDVKSSEDNDQQLPASPVLKQIEFNTIASGLGGLVSAIWKVHRYNSYLHTKNKIMSRGMRFPTI